MQKDYIGTEKCGSDTPKNTGETLYLGSTSSESFKRERWVKLRCLYNSRGRCFIRDYEEKSVNMIFYDKNGR